MKRRDEKEAQKAKEISEKTIQKIENDVIPKLKENLMSILPKGTKIEMDMDNVPDLNLHDACLSINIDYIGNGKHYETKANIKYLKRGINFVFAKNQINLHDPKFTVVIYHEDDGFMLNDRDMKTFTLKNIVSKKMEYVIIQWIKNGFLHVDTFYRPENY